MRNTRMPISLADAQITLSGVMHAQPAGTTHLPLATALQLSLDVVRLVAKTHDGGRVIGVLDAAHLICLPDGALTFGGKGGNPIAPELKRGDAPDRLSDVYALGAVIYRLLTGHKVDTSRFVEPPSHFNPAVDTSLDELVLQALDEDPSERPYSARELEQRLLEVFAELGLEPGEHAEATRLITSSLPKKQEEAAEEDELVQQPHGGFGRFLYDLGWVNEEPAWTRAPLGAEEGEAFASGVTERRRNRLSQFMYDLGWLQGIDWDAPKTLLWLKRGGIAFAVLLLIMICWPGSKEPKLTAAQKALIAQTKRSAEPAVTAPAPKVPKPAAVAKPSSKTTRANARR